MAITEQDFKSGKIFRHIPSQNLYAYQSGGLITKNGERALKVVTDGQAFWIGGDPPKFLSDCELSDINFTQCPHCKKHF